MDCRPEVGKSDAAGTALLAVALRDEFMTDLQQRADLLESFFGIA